MANVWQDPPKNITAGGLLTTRSHEGTVSVDTHNSTYFCGFKCEKVGSDYNESVYYQTFTRFMMPFPVISGITYAGITFRVPNAKFYMYPDESMLGHPIHVYTYAGEAFPYVLTEDDASMDDWNFVGAWENIYDIATTIDSTGPYWLQMFDVTSGFIAASNNGYPYFAVRLRPFYTEHYVYNYYEYPGYDKESRVHLYGSCIGTAAWCESPPGFPSTTPSGIPVPWLKIVCDEEQWVPGEDNLVESITCISSDYKSKAALIGTNKGGLWVTWNYGANWAKIYETVASGVV